MSSKLCAPYEGDLPYLYISYCPEDMDIILPILRFLQDEGYRIWYDDSRVPGSEWPGTAARRLDQSAAFLALISENWIASHQCLEEFTFAQMRRLSSLAVILKPVQLTPETNLQIVSVPAVDRTQSTPGEFQDRLLEQLDKLDPALRQDPAPVPPVSRSKLPLIITIAAALIFVVGIVAAVLARGKSDDPLNTPNPPVVPTESITPPTEPSTELSSPPEPELDYSAAYHILLTVPENMPLEEFPGTLSTLRERLDIFTGGEPYEINVEDDSIELYLPKSAFAGIGVENVLKCYLTRAIELYIFNRASPATAREPIRRNDLSSVTLSQGTIPGVDAVQYGIYSPTYNYLTIQLTDQCAEWFKEEIAAWGDGIAFGQDMESVLDYAYYYTFPAGDGKTFYVLNNDLGGQFLETLAYNLTHDPLTDNFSFTIDLNSLADWQTTEGESRMGENQCDPSALEGATVTFILEGYHLWTAEDVLNAEKELKARLDMLDQPYALGRIEDDEEDVAVFAVRTGMEHMGIPVIPLIGGKDVCLQVNYFTINLQNCNFTWETTPDGICLLALEVDSKVTDQLTELTKEMVEQDNALYLAVGGLSLLGNGGLPVLRASIGQSVSDGRIIFDRLCFGQETRITEEYLWLTALMEWIINDSSLAPRLHWMQQIQMNLEDGVIGYDRNRFGMSYAKAEQAFADAVYAIVPDATVAGKQDMSCVYVSLDLDPNENLPERAAALAQEIYEASGFEQSIFQDLTIYLIEEDNSVNERARIFFKKGYSYVLPQLDGPLPDNGYTYISGIFQGGRLEQYQSTFQHIVETDPFFLRLTSEGQTSWKW